MKGLLLKLEDLNLSLRTPMRKAECCCVLAALVWSRRRQVGPWNAQASGEQD